MFMETPDKKYQDDQGKPQMDSPINMEDAKKNHGKKSLTNDEDADTDPNDVADKPSFSDNEKGKFDGNIGI